MDLVKEVSGVRRALQGLVCDPYKKLSADGTRCNPVICGVRDVVLVNGDCFECEEEEIPQDARTCIPHPSPCGFRAIGKPPNCITCPEYT